MKSPSAFAAGLRILAALVFANTGLLLLVIATDVLFGCPPQYSVPMFLPLAVGLGALLASMRVKRAASPAFADRADPRSSDTPERTAAGIRSEVIIRRRPAFASNSAERRAYSETAL